MTGNGWRHFVFNKERKDGLYEWHFAPDGRKRGTERHIVEHSRRLASDHALTFKPSSWGMATLGLAEMERPHLKRIREAIVLKLQQAGLL